MKIVQTFWSGGKKDPENHNYGWKNSKYHLLGWILSSNQLRKFYSQVELYTDRAGYELLIEKLKLPYSNVHIILDDLNTYDSDLWALPKIRTYSLQDSSFLHVDGDVFIWERFSQNLLSSALIAQNEETETRYYRNMISGILPGLKYIPALLQPYFIEDKNMRMFNMGITGGTNSDFFREYASMAFDFVDQNIDNINTISRFNFNIFFEQLLFYKLAQEKNSKVKCLFEGITEDESYQGFGDFDKVPEEKSYLHLLGSYKRNEIICRKLETEVLLYYPEYFFRLKNILPEHFSEIPAKKSIIEFINQPIKEQSEKLYSALQSESTSKSAYPAPEILIKRDLFNRLITLKPAIINDPDVHFYLLKGSKQYHVEQKEQVIPTGIDNTSIVKTLKDVDVVEIPEYDGGSSEFITDDINDIILHELETPKNFEGLLLKVENYLEDTTDREFLDEFRELIKSRIQKLLTSRRISIKISCTTRVEVEKPLIE
jgi:hypothetical protein